MITSKLYHINKTELLLLSRCDQTQKWHDLFKVAYTEFGRYIECFREIKKAWTKIETYIKKHMSNNVSDILEGMFSGSSARKCTWWQQFCETFV